MSALPYEQHRLKFVLSKVQQGASPQCEDRQADEGEWGVLKAGCANGGQFRPAENKALPASTEPWPDLEIEAGDLLISRANTTKLAGSAAYVYACRRFLLLCDKLYRLVVRAGRSDARYLAYSLGSHPCRAQIESQATGASGSMQNISQDIVRNLLLPIPPLPTQKAIADFLDRKTAAIDALIEKKQKLLELLAEKRAALINQAVTKGLDPGVPMKDSGVPWIGEIPGHWAVMQLRRQITLQRGVDITKDEQREGAVPVISSGGTASWHDTAYARGPGVVVGRKGSAGTVHYVRGDYWPHDTTLWVKDFKGNEPRFVYYKLLDMRLATFDTGSANPTVNRNLVHPVPVVWPPVGEQRSIAFCLDEMGAAHERVQAALGRAVARLQEYRQALITAAVTGQIEIPEEAA